MSGTARAFRCLVCVYYPRVRARRAVSFYRSRGMPPCRHQGAGGYLRLPHRPCFSAIAISTDGCVPRSVLHNVDVRLRPSRGRCRSRSCRVPGRQCLVRQAPSPLPRRRRTQRRGKIRLRSPPLREATTTSSHATLDSSQYQNICNMNTDVQYISPLSPTSCWV